MGANSIAFPLLHLLCPLPHPLPQEKRLAVEGLCEVSLRIVPNRKGLYLTYFVPFASAVTADGPHVYFISRGGCLVSLSSDVINAQRTGPAVPSLMKSTVAVLLPTLLPRLKVSN